MPKILICGDVLTPQALALLHARVSALHASPHGPFDAVLCTGLGAAAALQLPQAAPFPVPLHFVLAKGASALAPAAECDMSEDLGASASAEGNAALRLLVDTTARAGYRSGTV